MRIIDKFTKLSINSLPDNSHKDSLILADSIPVEVKIETLRQLLITEKNNRKLYWNAIDQYSDSIMALTDTEITSKSSKGWGFISRLFDFKNDPPKTMDNYKNNLNFAKGGWCGPWALNWIYNTRFGGNKYSHFESFAGTIGLLGANYIFSVATDQKPMFPSEMNLSMIPYGMWVDPVFQFGQYDGYYYIRNFNRPIIIAIITSGQGHWIVAYGTKTTGTYAWKNYWYAINDNGAITSNSEYWWQAPWFIAYVRLFHF